jgi:hypothetical protein
MIKGMVLPLRSTAGSRATFPRIRESVRELLGKRMDKLARESARTHDPKVRDELSRLSIERGKLAEPWVKV